MVTCSGATLDGTGDAMGAGVPTARTIRIKATSAAQPGEMADQLHVGEVAGGERVRVAAAAEAEALDRPGADLADGEQPHVGAGIGQVGPAGGGLAGAADSR